MNEDKSNIGETNENISRAKRNEASGYDLIDKARQLVSSTKMSFDTETYQQIWSGSFDKISHLSLNKSMVRIFTSSTFVDTKEWRNELMRDVYPFLQDICSILGLDFRIVDMRWGVRESTGNDHGTSDLCFSEIYKCQELSLGPSFITFLGDRYGYRPFPRLITETEMKILLSVIRSNEVKALIEKWFHLDNNCIPPVYILQSVSTHYPDFINNSNQDLQRAASSLWWKDFEVLQTSLRLAAIETDIPSKNQFMTSVTNEEVRLGIIANEDRIDTTYAYIRDITFDEEVDRNESKDDKESDAMSIMTWETINVKEMKKFANLSPYSDWNQSTGKIDHDALYLQQQLKKVILPSLPHYNKNYNYFEFPISWSNESAGFQSKDYQTHITSFLNHFTLTVTSSVFQAYTNTHIHYSEYCREVLQHMKAVRDKAKQFLGQPIEKQDIFYKSLMYLGIPSTATTTANPAMAAATSSPRTLTPVPAAGGRLFIIAGASGSGKTTLLSKLAVSLQTYLSTSATATAVQYNFVIRLLGTTAMSGDAKSLLISLIAQISAIYESDKYADDVDKNWSSLNLSSYTFEQLVKLFYVKCRLATASSPLIIILDSLDQLSDEYDGRALTAWLLFQWKSPSVFIFVSLVPTIGPSFATLQDKFKHETDEEKSFHWFDCVPYTAEKCLDILQVLMNMHSVQFRDEQLDLLTTRICQVASPL